jgi:capsular exopolysaccharide synthesis family protein
VNPTTQAPLTEARRVLAILHRRRLLIAACTAVSLLAAFLHTQTTRPVYEARVRVLLEKPGAPLGQTDLTGIADDTNTLLEVLRGREIAERVVSRLGNRMASELGTGPMVSLWELVRHRMFGPPATPVAPDGVPLSPSASAFQSRVRVTPVAGTRLIDIRFSAYDPALTAVAANSLVDAFTELAAGDRSNRSGERTEWLEDQHRQQQQRVLALAAQLEQKRRAAGVDLGGDGERRTASLAATLSALQAERGTKQALLDQVRSGTNPADALPLSMQGGLAELRGQLRRAQEDQARLAEQLGERHPQMQEARQRVASLEQQLSAEARAVVTGLENEVRMLLQREATLSGEIASLRAEVVGSGAQAEIQSLEQQLDNERALLVQMTGQARTTELQGAYRLPPLRVLEPATTPGSPVSPRAGSTYRNALLLGLVIGIALALGFDALDNTVKTPEDVRDALGLSLLGVIPEAQPEEGPASRTPAVFRAGPYSAAEAYRLLRTNLTYSLPPEGGRLLVMSSANPGEGKTTTCANLAGALAVAGARVLAIDADLRRPTLHLHFGLQRARGLTDVIVGKLDLEAALQPTRWAGLSAITCGYLPPNPAELLASTRLRDMLHNLRGRFDWVLVDTPPVLAMADTSILAPFVDGVILVVGAEVSTRPAVQRSIDQLRGVGGVVLGAVLNRVDLKRNAYYYSHYYGDYYRSYYSAENPAAESGKLRRFKRS